MKSFLLFFFSMVFVGSLSAQWTDNTDLNTLAANSATGDLQSVGTSDGQTWIAFWHDVPGPQYYEMRLQLLDADGNPKFGPEGMVVNNTVSMSTFTTIWSVNVDADNNALIAFNGTGSDTKVYVHKISPAGVQLWGAQGVSPGSGYDAKTLPLPNGETIVSWLPANKAALQKINADGSLAWAAPVSIEPAVSNHKTSAGELAALPNGDFVVLIHDRGGFSPSALPYMQRYKPTGATAWTAPVALSTTYYTSFNRRYDMVADGDVVYFGYSGAQGIQPHGFIQRVNGDGSLPWGADGVDFSTQALNYERDVKMAYTEGSDVIWAICEYSDPSQGQVGEYVQKFDKLSGARLLGDEGKELFPISADYISHQGDLQLVKDQPVFLVSDGNSNGVFAKDLLAVKLDFNGDFEWTDKTEPVATNPSGVKSRIQFNAAYDGKVVAVWSENRDGAGYGLPYAQRVALNPCLPPVANFVWAADGLNTLFNIDFIDPTTTYFWNFGDGGISYLPNVEHEYAAAGAYTVCLFANNICGSDTLCQTIDVLTGVNEAKLHEYDLSLAPNPVSGGFFKVQLTLPEDSEIGINLTDALGRTVLGSTAHVPAGEQTIPVSADLAPGTYVVRVAIGETRVSLPLVVF